MPYKISGNLSDDARIIVIKEDDWSIESNTVETSGVYEQDPVAGGTKLVIARKSDGETLAYGAISAVYYAPTEYGYVIAGKPSGENPITDNDQYSPDTWVSKASAPGPNRQMLAATTISDKGYIFGGWDGGETDISDTDEYDPDTNSWASKNDFPGNNRRGLSSTTIDNKGYIFGGWVGPKDVHSDLGDTDEYTPSSNSWSGKTNFPGGGRGYTAACEIDNSGYVFGGWYSGDTRRYVVKYDPDTWTWREQMLEPKRHSMGCCEIDGKAYIFGGRENEAGGKWDTDEYDPDTNTWTSKTNIPEDNNFGLSATNIDSKGYLFCGHASNKGTDEYSPDTWTVKSNMPNPPRIYAAATTI